MPFKLIFIVPDSWGNLGNIWTVSVTSTNQQLGFVGNFIPFVTAHDGTLFFFK